MTCPGCKERDQRIEELKNEIACYSGWLANVTEDRNSESRGYQSQLKENKSLRAEVARLKLEKGAAVWMAERDRREGDAVLVEAFAANFPKDVFTEPPPGEHGKSVDSCSARAIRHACKNIAQAIRSVEVKP